MDHKQMAQITLQYINIAEIPGSEAGNMLQCQRWLLGIAQGNLKFESEVTKPPTNGEDGDAEFPPPATP